MPLRFEVESLDEVPESLKTEYVEANGRYRLALEGYEDPVNLKSALQKEREAARKYSSLLKQYEQIGASPEEIKEKLTSQPNSADWDKMKAQLAKQHQNELSARDEKLHMMRGTVERYLVDAEAANAIAASKGVPELLLPLVKTQVRVVDDESGLQVRVVDSNGEPRINSKGDYMTISDLVSEMRASEVYGRAFEASGNRGSGTPPNAGSGGTNKPRTWADAVTPQQKVEFLRAKQNR